MIPGESPARPLELGIFARTFRRDSLDATLRAAAANAFRLIHFNFACAGLPSLPDALEPETCRRIRDAFIEHHLVMLGVSATYNTIHPDRERRDVETARAVRVIELGPTLGTGIVSLSTGTRDPDDMWRRHPANEDPASWSDLLNTVSRLVQAAEQAGVVLGIEPERNNVVSSARRAIRLLGELRSASLGIILDPANLVDPARPETQHAVLEEAFDLLAPWTVMVHAKDVVATGHVAAGLGLLDYGYVFELIRHHRLEVPVVIHDVDESDVDRARAFVESLAAPARERMRAGR